MATNTTPHTTHHTPVYGRLSLHDERGHVAGRQVDGLGGHHVHAQAAPQELQLLRSLRRLSVRHGRAAADAELDDADLPAHLHRGREKVCARERERQTDRETDREKNTQSYTVTCTERDRERDMHSQ